MSDFVIEFQNQTEELNSLNQQIKSILEEKEKTEQSLEFWQKEFQKRTNHFKRMEMNLKTRIRTLEDEVKKLGGQI
jgi:predicted  nucleic acid-binding Zn-ribbon protein